MTILTEDLIIQKTRENNLSSIIRINIWGYELEDISILEKLVNIEIVTLSLNKIHSLKTFQKLNKLKELYLRKNSISSFQEIEFLTDLVDLRIIWLSENPICELPEYRFHMIRLLPQLQKLDNIPVTIEERQEACKIKLYEIKYLKNNNIPQKNFSCQVNIKNKEDVKDNTFPFGYSSRELKSVKIVKIDINQSERHKKKSFTQIQTDSDFINSIKKLSIHQNLKSNFRSQEQKSEYNKLGINMIKGDMLKKMINMKKKCVRNKECSYINSSLDKSIKKDHFSNAFYAVQHLIKELDKKELKDLRRTIEYKLH